MALLVVLGIVKPVRAGRSFAQRAWEIFPALRPWLRPPYPLPLVTDRRPTELYSAPSWWRRSLSLLTSAALSVVTGLVGAVLIATAAIWVIRSLTGRLK